MDNPYQSPDNASPPHGEEASPWKAVFLGLVIDFGGTIVMSIAASIGYSSYLALQGWNQQQIVDHLEQLPASHPFALAMTLAGLAISTLAGYAVARMIKRDELHWGMIQAAITTSIGIVLGATQVPLAMNALMAVIGFAAVTMGASLGASHNAARREGDPFEF